MYHDGLKCLVECKIFELPPYIIIYIIFNQFCFFLLESVFFYDFHRLNSLR